MDYSSFLEMKAELSLVAVMVILLIYDLFAGEKGMRWFQPLACILVAAQILYNIVPTGNVEILGGMYQSPDGERSQNHPHDRYVDRLPAGP